MKISQKGLELIKKFEGCKLYAYRCAAGVLTIGYGHTKNVKAGMAITQQQAEEFLKEDIAPIEKALNAMCVSFTQGQFDSLCSWIFNLGAGNFNSSTMKKCIVQKKPDIDVARQMVKWYNAAGKPLLGLKKRRCEEANMYVGHNIFYLDAFNNIKEK